MAKKAESERAMRAKVRITGIKQRGDINETVVFSFPAKDGPYPPDGSDEDQQFAKFSPSAALSINITNPALLGKFKEGDTFYLDFIPTT